MPTIKYVTHAEEIRDDLLVGDEVESDVDVDVDAFDAEDDGLDAPSDAQNGTSKAPKGGK